MSSLAIRSKAHWDYSAAQMEVFAAELTIGEDRLDSDHVHVAVLTNAGPGEFAGMYSLEYPSKETLGLGHLFVAPEAMGLGVGAALLRHACELGSALGYASMEILSDPNAEGFYLGKGARRVGEIESSIPGRRLPVLGLALGAK